MQPGRAIVQRQQFGQYPLRLAQCIAQQDGSFAALFAFAAPRHDLRSDGGRVRPTIDRQGKGGLGDEGIAGHHFERRTGWIRLALVVAGRHPDLLPVVDAHLRRPQYMAGGMQRYLHPAQAERHALGMRLHRHIAQAPAQDRQAAVAAVVLAHARACVIAVAMGDDRARDRSPGIDVEITGGAVQPFWAQDHQIVIDCHAVTVAGRSCTG